MSGRYYALDDMGPVCPTCLTRVPKAIAQQYHPTCYPADQARPS